MKNFFFIALLLISCQENIKTLPSSTGSFSEIVFVVDDLEWENKISKLVHQIFAASIKGINQDEPSHKIIQVNISEFNNVLKRHKNVILISKNAQEETKINKWAKEQLVVKINSNEKPDLITNQLLKIKSIFDLNELKFIRKKLAKKSNTSAEQKIHKIFKIDVIIPEEYTIIEEKNNFFWATYNPAKEDQIKQILVFAFQPNTKPLYDQVLSKTDSIFSNFLFGKNEDRYVKIEPLYKPYFNNNIYRGIWRLENGFMGGPFLSKQYFIESNVVVTVGLVFAPNSIKRKYIKEFEAIL